MTRPNTARGTARREARKNPSPSMRLRDGKQVKFGAGRGPQAPGDNGDDFTELFNVEPFLRNQITLNQINHLRNRIDSEGLTAVAKEIELDGMVLLRVCAGFGHRCTPGSAQVLRDYFAEAKVRS